MRHHVSLLHLDEASFDQHNFDLGQDISKLHAVRLGYTGTMPDHELLELAPMRSLTEVLQNQLSTEALSSGQEQNSMHSIGGSGDSSGDGVKSSMGPILYTIKLFNEGQLEKMALNSASGEHPDSPTSSNFSRCVYFLPGGNNASKVNVGSNVNRCSLATFTAGRSSERTSAWMYTVEISRSSLLHIR